jgi:hypothetical protein
MNMIVPETKRISGFQILIGISFVISFSPTGNLKAGR